MAGVLNRFSFATAAEKQLKHTKRCKKHCLTGLNLGNDDSISSKVIRTQTEQFLELFSRTLNVFAPLRCEDIITYYCFDRTRLF